MLEWPEYVFLIPPSNPIVIKQSQYLLKSEAKLSAFTIANCHHRTNKMPRLMPANSSGAGHLKTGTTGQFSTGANSRPSSRVYEYRSGLQRT